MVDASGTIVANYRYNAWGKLYSQSGTMAIMNPLRYRGYYYDTETGFYYLQSRYYDPANCRFINADVLLDQSSFAGTNIFVYCANNPIMCVDPIGYCAKPLGTGIFSFRQRLLGRMSRMLLLEEETETATEIDPNSPPDHPDYIPPKKGGKSKVKNPNGKGWGWPDKNGGVWVYTPKMHGGEGWTIQYPGGGHSHAYPGGGVRSHFEAEQPTITSIIEIFVGGIVTIGLIADDVTIVGASNDTLITASLAVFFSGISGLSGNRVCTECKEEEYGY